jgi:hypothetical protein
VKEKTENVEFRYRMKLGEMRAPGPAGDVGKSVAEEIRRIE